MNELLGVDVSSAVSSSNTLTKLFSPGCAHEAFVYVLVLRKEMMVFMKMPLNAWKVLCGPNF